MTFCQILKYHFSGCFVWCEPIYPNRDHTYKMKRIFFFITFFICEMIFKQFSFLLSSMEQFLSILFLFAFIKCYKYCFMSRTESKSEMIKRIKKHFASQKRPIDGRVERTRIQKNNDQDTPNIKSWMQNCSNISL